MFARRAALLGETPGMERQEVQNQAMRVEIRRTCCDSTQGTAEAQSEACRQTATGSVQFAAVRVGATLAIESGGVASSGQAGDRAKLIMIVLDGFVYNMVRMVHE